MNLFCIRCGAPLRPEDVNTSTGTARCRSCELSDARYLERQIELAMNTAEEREAIADDALTPC